MTTISRWEEVVFDLEGNGLYYDITELHCLWVGDMQTGERLGFADKPDLQGRTYNPIENGVRIIMNAKRVVAHNGIEYDIRVLKKFFAWFISPEIIDTIVVARLLFPPDYLWGLDMKKVMTNRLAQKYARRQSLESWGARLGELKGEYVGEGEYVGDRKWERFNRSMYDYNEQDIIVNAAAWRFFKKKLGWYENAEAEGAYIWPEWWVLVEMELHAIIVEQRHVGFGFNVPAAQQLAAELSDRRDAISALLKEEFGCWWVALDDPKEGFRAKRTARSKLTQFPDVKMPRYGSKGQRLKDYVGPPLQEIAEGSRYTRIKWHEFNPSSRQDLADRLVKLRGWKPTVFGDAGPTLDESVVKTIPDDVLSPEWRTLIEEFFIVEKTYGMVANGNKSWLALVGQVNAKPKTNLNDGRMHGRIDPLGSNTGRGIHMEPNQSQVPSVQVEEIKDASGKVIEKKIIKGWKGKFGWECRNLFVPREDWEETGTDIASLELALLGHYLVPLDGGIFAERMGDPSRDPHTEHGELTDLPRRETKTTTYAYIFGAGPPLIGEQCGYENEDREALLSSTALHGYVRYLKKRLGDNYVEPTEHMKLCIAKGSIVIKKFETGIKGLKKLKDDLRNVAKERGWIKSIGGRIIRMNGKAHLGLNYCLQGGGSDVCKLWIVLFHRRMKKLGFLPGVHWNQMAWIHDEKQKEHQPAIREIVQREAMAAITEAGVMLGIRTKLRGESKTGKSWAECH